MGGLTGEDDPIHRDAFAGQDANTVADLHLLCRDDLFPAVFQDPGRLRRQMDQLFDAGSGLCHRQLLQQRAQLHDKGHFSGGKGLSDAERGDQRQRDQHIRLDVKGRYQPDDRFQNDGYAAQNDSDPCQIKGKRRDLQQTAKNGGAGERKKQNILFDAAKLQR